MRAIYDFIVYTDKEYNETFKTKSGFELYADKRFLANRLAQIEVKIYSMPFLYKGKDITGYEAVIDPTIYYKQNYDKVEGTNLGVKGKRGYFKVPESMVICIRKNKNERWEGFGNNLLVEPIYEKAKDVKVGLIITEIKKEKEMDGICKVVVSNKELENEGVKEGDVVFYDNDYAITFYLDNNIYKWVMTSAITGIQCVYGN